MNKKQNAMLNFFVFIIQLSRSEQFNMLRNRCLEMTKKQLIKYYLTSFEDEDFSQEANLILYNSYLKWDIKRKVNFADYYSRNLYNHLNTLVRKEHTNKCIINKKTLSLEELLDKGWKNTPMVTDPFSNPENIATLNETIREHFAELSSLEKDVYVRHLQGVPTAEIAKELGETQMKVQGAIYRCNKKRKQL